MTGNASLLEKKIIFEMSFETRVKIQCLPDLYTEDLIQTRGCKCKCLLSLGLTFYSLFLVHYSPYVVSFLSDLIQQHTQGL